VAVSAGEQAREQTALTVFAAELRSARNARGLSQDALGELVRYSPSLIGMIESCRRVATLDFCERADEALGTQGLLARLHPLIVGQAYPSWFRPYLDLERAARTLRSWEPLLVPGLLQTADYARAVIQAARPTDEPGKIEEAVAARLERQAILDREDPPMCWFILDEAVFQRPVGGPKVIEAQVHHLLAQAARPKIVIQVIEFEAGAHPGLTGALVLASFDGQADAAYLDTLGPGLIADRPETVADCVFAFDNLRAEALSPAKSIDLMRKEAQRWT
jgi:transcriptional regulator with XRE-family HTH domain